MAISQAGSMKGYSFKKWLQGTKDSFKTLLTAGFAVLGYYVGAAFSNNESLGVLACAASAALSKWLLDLVDFWLSDVEV